MNSRLRYKTTSCWLLICYQVFGLLWSGSSSETSVKITNHHGVTAHENVIFVHNAVKNLQSLGIFYSGYFPSVLILYSFTPTRLWRWKRQCVPKRRFLIFRRRGNTQKKIYHIYNTARDWKLRYSNHLSVSLLPKMYRASMSTTLVLLGFVLRLSFWHHFLKTEHKTIRVFPSRTRLGKIITRTRSEGFQSVRLFKVNLTGRTRYDQWINNRHSFIIAKINVISLFAIPRFPSDAAVLTCDHKLASCTFKNVNKNRGGKKNERRKRSPPPPFFCCCGAERTLRNWNSILLNVSRVDARVTELVHLRLYFPAHFCSMSVHLNNMKPTAEEDCQYRC
jgi:hypothetical protein